MLQDKKAFTLVELLMVLAVFSTVTIMTAGIFVASTRAQKKVSELQKIQGDARYTFEAMVREIKSARVDYGYYQDPDGIPATNDAIDLSNPLGVGSNGWGGVNTPTKVALALIRSDGTSVRFREESGVNCLASPCITVSTNGGSTWVALTPEGIAVQKLVFVVTPVVNPYSSSTGVGQPVVSLQLATATTNPKQVEVARTTYQTTIVSRQYVR